MAIYSLHVSNVSRAPCRAAVGSSVLIDNRRNAGRNR